MPVLYGPTPNNADSAVNILLDIVADQSGKQYKMDHYATRFPTCVVDIADFLVRLACANLSSRSYYMRGLNRDCVIALPPSRPVPPILHYSSGEPFTKYEMCLVFARILGVSHAHIIPDAEPPKVRLRPSRAQTRPTVCGILTNMAGRRSYHAPARLPAVHTRDGGPHGGLWRARVDAIRGVVDRVSE